MRALVAYAVIGLALGCSSQGDTGGGGRGEVPSPWEGAGGGAAISCLTREGVRVCGGADAECPILPSPECPGYGCTPAYDLGDDAASSAGVCWADIPNGVSDGCSACPDGMLCAAREPGGLVCVPETVCAALWDLGERDVCTYADKSRYDHRPLPEPAGCPMWADGLLCGGGCGDCGYGRCTGRSPRHPYGLCNYGATMSTVKRCQVGGELTCWGDEVCAVFAVPAADEPTARAHGLCMGALGCAKVAMVIPGGLHCYDAAGVDQAP